MNKVISNTKQTLKKLNKIHLLISPFVFVEKVLKKLLFINNSICFKILKLFLKKTYPPA